MTYICVGTNTIIGSDNGLSPGRRQAIIWTNAWILLIRPLGRNYSETLIENHIFSFKKILFKVSSVKWQPFCLGLNVLKMYLEIILMKYWSLSESQNVNLVLTLMSAVSQRIPIKRPWLLFPLRSIQMLPWLAWEKKQTNKIRIVTDPWFALLFGGNNINMYLHFMSGSGYEGAAVLLPSFAIIW